MSRQALAVVLGIVLVLALGAAAFPRSRHSATDSAHSVSRPTASLALAPDASATPRTAGMKRRKALATAVRTPIPTAQPTPVTPKTRRAQVRRSPAKPPYLVLFVLDGARPDYFNVPGIPHIRALMQSGTRYTNAFAGILESETPSGHASIGTGSLPRQDGILSFNWADSDNTTIDLFNPTLVRSGLLERIMSRTGVPTIAGQVHASDPTAKVVALSGHKYYAADAMGGPDANVIMYYSGTPDGHFAPTAIPGHMPPAGILSQPDLATNTTHLPPGIEDHLAMKLDLATFARLHQRVTLMNVPEFDWPLGHVDGANRDPALVKTLMQDFDRDLGKLEATYRKAGILNRTIFVITADHGFAPIYHTVSATDIQHAVDAAGTSIISDSYHTAAYLWLKDPAKAAAAAENLARLQNPFIQSVYFKESVPGGYDYVRASGPELFHASGAEAANQYLLHTFQGPTGPDVAVFFTEDSASNPGGQKNWKGDHGGNDWEAQHIPLILSGPGVQAGKVSGYPAQLMDIAPTVLSLMHMSSAAMQGTPLANAMRSTTSAAIARQLAVRNQRMPVVTSLRAESRLEIAAGQ